MTIELHIWVSLEHGYSYPGAPPKRWYEAFYPEKKAKGFDELKYYSRESFN